MKIFVSFDTVILFQKGNNQKEGKHYIHKYLFYKIEKLNQHKHHMG